jgi:hypothetical protein
MKANGNTTGEKVSRDGNSGFIKRMACSVYIITNSLDLPYRL